jgi:hypothetical protein
MDKLKWLIGVWKLTYDASLLINPRLRCCGFLGLNTGLTLLTILLQEKLLLRWFMGGLLQLWCDGSKEKGGGCIERAVG